RNHLAVRKGHHVGELGQRGKEFPDLVPLPRGPSLDHENRAAARGGPADRDPGHLFPPEEELAHNPPLSPVEKASRSRGMTSHEIPPVPTIHHLTRRAAHVSRAIEGLTVRTT